MPAVDSAFGELLADFMAKRAAQEVLPPGAGAPAAAAKARPAYESWRTASEWALAVFGAASPAVLVSRALGEMVELVERAAEDAPREAWAEEIADIQIVLFALCGRLGLDPQACVDAKMTINRDRRWRVDGYGRGYQMPGFDPRGAVAKQIVIALGERELTPEAAVRLAWADGASREEAERFVSAYCVMRAV